MSAAQSLKGLPPLINPASARTLILGSMPSEASLAEQAYYAHPRNQFWPLMEALFGVARDLPYPQRCKKLVAHNVAVWDVLSQCLREGSLDSSIVESSIVPNDIGGFLQSHHTIQHVFFNGHKSRQIFKRYIADKVSSLEREITYQRLPSTSPANAGLSLDEKLQSWRVVAECSKS